MSNLLFVDELESIHNKIYDLAQEMIYATDDCILDGNEAAAAFLTNQANELNCLGVAVEEMKKEFITNQTARRLL